MKDTGSRAWTLEDKNQLQAMCRKESIAKIAVRLGRSEAAIRRRAEKLGISLIERKPLETVDRRWFSLSKLVLAIAGAVALTLVGVGPSVMSMTPPEYNLARAATVGFGLATGIAFCTWALSRCHSRGIKLGMGGFVLLLVFVGYPLCLVWISQRERLYPSNTGVLTSSSRIIFSPSGPFPHFEIGNSDTIFEQSDEYGEIVFPFLRRDQFKI
jgi:hypothetical protein